MGIFLDIEGAFDNTPFDAMCRSALDHGVEPLINKWMKTILTDRLIEGQLNSSKAVRRVRRGCPQGGVLSPLLWCLVLDSLISELNGKWYAQAYADDLAIVVAGKFPDTIMDLSQQALNTVHKWCSKYGLAINPSKAEIVMFTRKRLGVDNTKTLLLSGQEISFKPEVKYLGVILDKKLSWRAQVQDRVKRAMVTLWTCSRALGRTWGLKPIVMYWIYTSVIKPMVMYGALVWWSRTKLVTARKELSSIQRMACLAITGAMRTAPTVALEALLGLPPLHLEIKAHAKGTALRLHNSGDWTKSSELVEHGKILEGKSRELMAYPSDRIKPITFDSSLYKVEISLRKDWDINHLTQSGGFLVYTDGSKMSGKVGAGVWGEKPHISISIPLGTTPTVFQAEVMAILICTQNLAVYKRRNITILSDSQAALKALIKTQVTSKLVLECRTALESLARNNRVKLTRVPGHYGVLGNEQADFLARKGAESPYIGPEPAVGLSEQTLRAIPKNWSREEHRKIWRYLVVPRQSKMFIKLPGTLLKDLKHMNRNQMSMLVGLLTGHGHLLKHLHTMGSQNHQCVGNVEKRRRRHTTSCVNVTPLLP
ncbi:uncharacterized protein LOC126837807 [Adelges cooleyi]|uniref:uncharacterized protein LOC126837807 n=1 Tax=Adelges cooleyi TaxID=133065 RepID=UPI0021802FBE|nr:uncharacterized protein LOC126837807 [Adelges cooleyi]